MMKYAETPLRSKAAWALALLLLGLAFPGSILAQTLLYTDADAPAGGDGLSWDTAFQDLQDALAAAAVIAGPVEIWVAEGRYLPDRGTGDVFQSFLPTGFLTLLGGFDGTEDDPADRDWWAHPTVLDGDLNGDDLPDFTNHGDNTRGLVKILDPDGPVVIDGFTLRGGYAYDVSELFLGGGAVFVERGDLRIAHCLFEDNWCGYPVGGIGNFGGAVYIKGSGVLDVANSIFRHNLGGYGGAVGAFKRDGGDIDVHLFDCVFQENIASQEDGPGTAGAVYFYGSKLVIERCDFDSNEATDYVGALYAILATGITIRDTRFHANVEAGRSAVHLERSDALDANPAVIENCDFTENVAHFGFGSGSALYLEETIAHVTGCRFLDNTNYNFDPDDGSMSGRATVFVKFEFGHRFTNCLFAGNHAALVAGLLIDDAGAEVINTTFADNTAALEQYDGAGLAILDSDVTVHNTILWGNRVGTGHGAMLPGIGGEDAQIAASASIVTITHSLVEGWTGNLGGVNNFGENPVFVGAPQGDYHLRERSPAIDVGDDAVVPVGVLVDLDGLPRFVDGDGDETVTVDLGAYENPGTVIGVETDAIRWPTGLVSVKDAIGSDRVRISF